SLGRCSLIWMPGTAVGMALYGPPLTWPGFRSKVSIWLGPPVIHRRMQAFLRFGCAAASLARASNHPAALQLATPADISRSQSRREIWGGRELGVMVIFLGIKVWSGVYRLFLGCPRLALGLLTLVSTDAAHRLSWMPQACPGVAHVGF